MTQETRQQWLKRMINVLEDLALWQPLTPDEELWLGAYKEELAGIIAKEKGDKDRS